MEGSRRRLRHYTAWVRRLQHTTEKENRAVTAVIFRRVTALPEESVV
jgi:hypothetical protein